MAVTNATLTVGMITIPVGLTKVADAKEPTFDRATKNGNAIARVERDSVTAEVIDPDTFPVVRGVYENPKDKTGFREIDAEKIAEIEAETKLEEFAVEAFIPMADLPTERFTAAYFVKAQKGVNAKPLRLIHDAMKATGTAGVFKLALRSRQQAAVIFPKDGGLFVCTLAFAADFTRAASASEQLDAVEADPKMVALATDLIASMTTTVADSLDKLEDDLVPLRASLIEEALAGKALTKKGKKADPKVKVEEKEDPLTAALKASIAAAGQNKSAGEKVAA